MDHIVTKADLALPSLEVLGVVTNVPTRNKVETLGLTKRLSA